MASSQVVVPLRDVPADPTLDGALATECPRYVELVRKGLAIKHGAGFGDVEALDAFRLTGPDSDGRDVFMFIPSHVPEGSAEDLVEQITLHALVAMHEAVIKQQRPFTVVWLCNNGEAESQLSLSWFRRTYYSVPFEYHQRMAALCLVHPSLKVKSILFLLSYLPRHDFWYKLNFADRLEFLDANVPVALIKTVPDAFKAYDKQLDREMYESVDRLAETTAACGMGGMGLGAGMGGLGGSTSASGLSGDGEGVGAAPQRPIELPKRNWEREQ